MNSNQAKYLLKCASGLQKRAGLDNPLAFFTDIPGQLRGSMPWLKDNRNALLGAAGGGLLGAGAGYLLSDEDKKKKGMLAGGLTGMGIGGVGGFSTDSTRNNAKNIRNIRNNALESHMAHTNNLDELVALISADQAKTEFGDPQMSPNFAKRMINLIEQMQGN